ncbi:unnamed protein product, partial [Leptidea sinapis]
VSYVGYTPQPRNSYGRGAWRGRGARGRGGPAGRGAGRPRRARRSPGAPVRATTLTVNGKTVRPDEMNLQLDEGSAHEDNAAFDNDVEGSQQQKGKSGKGVKKNMGKGKKKSSKPDAQQSVESNGPLEKNKVMLTL